jgi:ATP-dependent Clp protease ATP-binding subunit ClpC
LLHALWTDQAPCILAATPAEYDQCLRRRPALGGCVQPILVRPATVEQAVAVLRGVRQRYEKHHGVGITDEALTTAAEQADRQLRGALPGKAVVLLDRAASRARIKAGALPPDVGARVRELDEQIGRLNREKEDLVGATEYQQAAERRDQAEALHKEKERLVEAQRAQAAVNSTVDAQVIAEVARDLAAQAPPGPAA